MKNNTPKTITKQANSLTVAQNYIERGWQPLPIAFKSKNPNFPEWQNFRCTASKLSQHFNGKPQNIGVLLGTASRNLIDVDLDSPEAVKLAPFFLPTTKAVFGRISKPKSHYLYLCEDAKTEKFQFGAMIAEIRAEGCQTVFPSSVHPSGEVVEWNADGEPASVTFAEIQKAVGKIASASALVKFWKDGNRHEIALALAGGLLRNGFNEDEALHFIKAVCIGANEDETLDRLKAVETTFERIGKGEKVTGFPKLAELTDKKLVETICRWLEFEKQDRDESPLNEIPSNFVLKENGLFQVTYEKKDNSNEPERKETFISSPLRVTALLRDENDSNWSRLLEFQDFDGNPHELILPNSLFATDGAEVKARLYESGLRISRSQQKQLLSYISESIPKKRALCVSLLGFHNENTAFVFPDGVVSAEPQEIYLQNIDRRKHKFKVSCELSQWQENIARYCVGNSRLMFAVSLAFASALLPLSNDISGGFHLHGTTSEGKTTALLVGGSVWGGQNERGFLETWRATANGLEAIAELHNHSLLILDEIKQVNPHEIGEIIYQLSNGFGKSRAKQDASSRQKKEWNLLFLSSGELTLADLLKATNERLYGGQEARFVQIEASAGNNGLFEDLHGIANGADFSKMLQQNSKQFYGAAIREFLMGVLKNKETVKRQLQDAEDIFSAKLKDREASGEVYRIASRFALVCAGGVLASMFGVTNWQTSDVIKTIGKMFDDWLAIRGGYGNSDLQQGVSQVSSFFQNQPHLFQNVKSEIPVKDRIGFVEYTAGITEYWVFGESFKNVMCNGFQARKVAEEFERLGYIRRSAKNSLQEQRQFKGLKQSAYYVFRFEKADAEKDAMCVAE